MKQKVTATKKEQVVIPVAHKLNSFCDPIKCKVVNDTEINLTKKKAFEFLEAKSFEGERSVRETHVQHLFDEWVAGRFMWNHVILSMAILDGEYFRLNGQHTCWMRVNIPEDRDPAKLMVRLVTYRVQDSSDLRALYSTFDRNAPRTASHIARVMLMDNAAGEGIPTSYIGKLMAGFKVHFSPKTSKSRLMGHDEWIGMVSKNYPALFNMVGRFYQIHANENKFLGRAGVLGAVFSTFEKSVRASDDFWTPVCNGIGLSAKTDARWKLRDWLIGHAVSVEAIHSKKTSTEETYRICIQAWNRWRAGENVSMLRPTDTRMKASA